jgi:hypothetical protein
MPKNLEISGTVYSYSCEHVSSVSEVAAREPLAKPVGVAAVISDTLPLN